MKKSVILLLCCTMTLCSCTSSQFGAAATGSGLGGMFGSAIGGILGGHHGSRIGAAVGMVLGGAGGAAIGAEMDKKDAQNNGSIEKNRHQGMEDDDDITYRKTRKTSPAANNRWIDLEVEHVVISDENDNHGIDAGEELYISFEIYNRGEKTLFDVAPLITSDSKYIKISPAATITAIEPGQGIRYRAMVRASSKLKDGKTIFKIIFGNKYTAKVFSIDTHN